jgi:hypothetical protein
MNAHRAVVIDRWINKDGNHTGKSSEIHPAL